MQTKWKWLIGIVVAIIIIIILVKLLGKTNPKAPVNPNVPQPNPNINTFTSIGGSIWNWITGHGSSTGTGTSTGNNTGTGGLQGCPSITGNPVMLGCGCQPGDDQVGITDNNGFACPPNCNNGCREGASGTDCNGNFSQYC